MQGDRTVLIYEYVPTEEPYLFAVAPFTSASAHQGVSYLPKVLCDIRKVEIARGVRLCKSSIELFFVKVPRTKVWRESVQSMCIIVSRFMCRVQVCTYLCWP